MSNLFTSFHFFSSFWLYSSSRFLDFCVILDVQQGYHLTKNISLIAGIEFFSSIKYTCNIFWCYSISCPLFLNSGQLVEEWFAFAMASWGQLCQRHVCTLRQYFCAHASHLNASFQYFTALATHVKPAFFRFWLAAVLYPVSVSVPLDRLSAVYWVSFTLVQSLRVSKLKNIHIRVLRGNTLARSKHWGTMPFAIRVDESIHLGIFAALFR